MRQGFCPNKRTENTSELAFSVLNGVPARSRTGGLSLRSSTRYRTNGVPQVPVIAYKASKIKAFYRVEFPLKTTVLPLNSCNILAHIANLLADPVGIGCAFNRKSEWCVLQ